jgi:16S rRNA processing protein RimM
MYLIGYILKPQGIKGEVKVNPVSPDPERYRRLEKVYIQTKDNTQTYSIQKVRVADRFVFLKLSGIDSRGEAELLRGAEILITANDLIQPSPDEYFVHDLVGCQVITVDGDLVGKLIGVVQLSSNDVYIVSRGTGDEILIPAVKQVIKQVNVKNQEIIIHSLEGLLD